MKVLRLLIYEGPDEWVLDTLERSIKGKMEPIPGKSITAIDLGTLPDAIEIFLKEKEQKG